MKKSTAIFYLICLAIYPLFAQQIAAPFNESDWDYGQAKVSPETFQGKSSIRIQDGSIFLKGVDFLNGTIEVDLNFPATRNFPGIYFRAVDADNSEHFYVRPHQSGNPDACQYTPNFNGVAGWQLYHGEGYGQAIKLVPDQWHHLKIVVKGLGAQVFFDDMEKPIVIVSELKRGQIAGKLGVNAAGPVHFANFSYQIDNKTYPDAPSSNTPIDQKIIQSWQISDLVADDFFDNKPLLNKKDQSGFNWKKITTENSGLINLASHARRSEGKNTIVSKLSLQSTKKQNLNLAFGYSDFVKVYVNGQLQYQGRNDYTSRDYRYLGTIGFFDAVNLNLKKGHNEVWFVVTERFGGWGVKAMFTEELVGVLVE
ncbi:MAG: hypothetical protein R2828_23105 [Saprospiraceae bacterium]